jgi:glutaredoxin
MIKRKYAYHESRLKSNRRKKLTLEESTARFLQEITPLVIQFLNDMEETEKRLVDTVERKVQAETRTSEALYEIIRMAKSQSVYKQYKRRAPKVLKEHHKNIQKIIVEKRSEGETFEQISSYLRKEQIPTLSGRGKWHAQTVHRFYEDNILSKED